MALGGTDIQSRALVPRTAVDIRLAQRRANIVIQQGPATHLGVPQQRISLVIIREADTIPRDHPAIHRAGDLRHRNAHGGKRAVARRETRAHVLISRSVLIVNKEAVDKQTARADRTAARRSRADIINIGAVDLHLAFGQQRALADVAGEDTSNIRVGAELGDVRVLVVERAVVVDIVSDEAIVHVAVRDDISRRVCTVDERTAVEPDTVRSMSTTRLRSVAATEHAVRDGGESLSTVIERSAIVPGFTHVVNESRIGHTGPGRQVDTPPASVHHSVANKSATDDRNSYRCRRSRHGRPVADERRVYKRTRAKVNRAAVHIADESAADDVYDGRAAPTDGASAVSSAVAKKRAVRNQRRRGRPS